MNRIRFGLAAIAAVVVSATFAAEAQTNVAQTIAQRKEIMKTAGDAMKSLTRMVRGETPWNQQEAAKAAGALTIAAPKIPDAFPRGTGPEAGKTDALPSVWQNWTDFQAKASALETEATKLLQLIKAGDQAGFKAQFPAVGRTCGGCHEGYRVKK